MRIELSIRDVDGLSSKAVALKIRSTAKHRKAALPASHASRYQLSR
jgi:hypothetical protein